MSAKIPAIMTTTSVSPTVFLCVGSNNIQTDSKTGIMTRLHDLIDMVRCHRPYADIIIIGLMPRRGNGAYVTLDFQLECNRLMRDLCVSRQCSFVSIWKEISSGRHLLAKDKVHLTTKGKKVLSDKVLEAYCMLNPISEN